MRFKTKEFDGGGGSHTILEPQKMKVVGFPWKEKGAGWVAFVIARDERKEIPAAQITVAPVGGLHGGWSWSFEWDSGDGRKNSVNGRHADPEIAKKQAEHCVKALVSLSYKIAKKKWEEFDGEISEREDL